MNAESTKTLSENMAGLLVVQKLKTLSVGENFAKSMLLQRDIVMCSET